MDDNISISSELIGIADVERDQLLGNTKSSSFSALKFGRLYAALGGGRTGALEYRSRRYTWDR